MEQIFNPEAPREHIEDLKERAERLEAEARETEIDVASKDGRVTVTVTTAGKIVDLRLNSSEPRKADFEEISRAVLATVQEAQEIGERVGRELAAKHLPGVLEFTELIGSLGSASQRSSPSSSGGGVGQGHG